MIRILCVFSALISVALAVNAITPTTPAGHRDVSEQVATDKSSYSQVEGCRDEGTPNWGFGDDQDEDSKICVSVIPPDPVTVGRSGYTVAVTVTATLHTETVNCNDPAEAGFREGSEILVTFKVNGDKKSSPTNDFGVASATFDIPIHVIGVVVIAAEAEAQDHGKDRARGELPVVGVSRLRVDHEGPQYHQDTESVAGVVQENTPVWVVPLVRNSDEDNPPYVRITADPEPNVRNEVLEALPDWEVIEGAVKVPRAGGHKFEDIRSVVVLLNAAQSCLIIARPGQDPNHEHRALIFVADLNLDWDMNENGIPDDEPREEDEEGREDLPGLIASPRDPDTPPDEPDHAQAIAYLLDTGKEFIPGKRSIKVEDADVARLWWYDLKADPDVTPDADPDSKPWILIPESEVIWDHDSPEETRQLFVEAYQPGSTRIRFTLRDDILRDEIGLVVGDANLTAYRPYQQVGDGEGNYGQFQVSIVPDEHEEDALLGPGIRLDSDDAFWDTEDDGIRVDISVSTDDENASFLWIVSPGLQLFEDKGLDEEIDTDEPVAAKDLPGKVFVRRAGVAAADPLEVRIRAENGDADSGDRLVFHQFSTAVLQYMGANQTPSDPPTPGMTFCSIAIELYNTGFDVHMFNEDYDAQLDLGQWKLPFVSRGGKLLIESAKENGFTNVALLGYSRGGGSVHETSVWNVDPNDNDAPNLKLVQSVYFDAVRETEVELLDPEGGDGRDNQRGKWWKVEKSYPEQPIYWNDEALDVKDGDGRSVVRANPELRRPVNSLAHSHRFQAPATWPADGIYELSLADLVITARGGPLEGSDDADGWLRHVERHGEFDELVDEKKAVIRQFLDAPGVPR